MRRGSGSSGTGRCAIVLALVASAFALAPASAAAACDPVMPKAEVAAGMTGTGWTVVRGRAREPFSVEILGVLPGAIAPGRDMILAEATSPAIGRAGGAWAGMSGSPVYVGGRLVGALAFGLGAGSGNSAVVGLTPAEDMLRVDSYPVATPPRRVLLPRSVASSLAARLGVSAQKTVALTQLKVPFAVSGVSTRGLQRVARFADARRLPLVPVGGAAASMGGAAAAGTPPEPGDNLAAVASYGDVTLAAVGTATYVCESRVLAFGHPLGLFGPTSIGLAAADALGVVPGFDGGFKLATVGETLGRIDQDRIAGVRGLLGDAPTTIPVRSSVSVPAQGTRLEGGTDVVLEDMAAFATFLQTAASIESAFDGIRPGTARLSWAIEGTRSGGAVWRLARSNLFAGAGELPFESGSEVAMQVDAILQNPFEDVRVTGVRVGATVDEGAAILRVERVLVAKGRGPFRKRASVQAAPGQRLRVRVVLKPLERGQPARHVDFGFRMPRNAPPIGVIEIAGAAGRGGEHEECMMEGGCADGVNGKSFPDLLRRLETAPRNDVLTAKLRVGPKLRVRVTRARPLAHVVYGGAMIAIGGGRGEGPPRPPGAEEVAVGMPRARP